MDIGVKMIEIIKADNSNIEELMSIRLGMLKIVNNMSEKDNFDKILVESSCEYFLAEAKEKGCTEISLDATSEGKPLYKALGFVENKEGMVLEL